MIVDIHAHVGAPGASELARSMPGFAGQAAATAARYRNPVTAEYARNIEPVWDHLLRDVPSRLAHMDSSSVSMQVVSVNPGQYYYWASPQEAGALVGSINDELAGLVQLHPDRFRALGTVALQHPELAAQQLGSFMQRPEFVGVQISTNAGGMDLSDPRFEDFWVEAERHQAVVFIHPLGCPQLTDRLTPSYLNNIIGQPLETTIALSHLIFTGVLDRHPGLRICAAHGGGYLPSYLGRSEHAYAKRPDSHSMQQRPLWYLQRMWFDTVVHSPEALRTLIDTVGVERLLVGTDYPFDMGVDEPDALVGEILGLDETERDAIRYLNALNLFDPASLLNASAVGLNPQGE